MTKRKNDPNNNKSKTKLTNQISAVWEKRHVLLIIILGIKKCLTETRPE